MVFVSSFIISVGLFSMTVKFSLVENEEISLSVDLPISTPFERALEVLDQLQDAESLGERGVLERKQLGVGQWPDY